MLNLGANQDKTNDDVMPFGKYKGMPLSTLSISYLTVFLEKCEFADNALKERIRAELVQRKEELPCFGKLFDKSRTCAKCYFADECSSLCGDNYDLFGDDFDDFAEYR